ncbi:hypothetical protein NPIL_134111 [Nephila pilipes]|uniref:Uncharacterized protein n=1 Tax=Nephila pilipes TaxID=299642 RepID=A0A8X6R5G9_NEPPI|nr:hypothetical protein NPIL_134111 [Nephila pilipes]
MSSVEITWHIRDNSILCRLLPHEFRFRVQCLSTGVNGVLTADDDGSFHPVTSHHHKSRVCCPQIVKVAFLYLKRLTALGSPLKNDATY